MPDRLDTKTVLMVQLAYQHRPDHAGEFCGHCGNDWPCTVGALVGALETAGIDFNRREAVLVGERDQARAERDAANAQTSKLAAELVRERRNMADLGDAKRALETLIRKRRLDNEALQAELARIVPRVSAARAALEAGLDPHATVAQTVTCARSALDTLSEALSGQEVLFDA